MKAIYCPKEEILGDKNVLLQNIKGSINMTYIKKKLQNMIFALDI